MVSVQLTGPERLRFNPETTNQLRDLEKVVSEEVLRIQTELLIFGYATLEIEK